MQRCTESPRAKGFTLIEVLVVVAIIALLVAILLPSLNKARAQARMSQCLSNSRQHAVAANMFVTETEGMIPRGGDRTTLNWTQLVLKMMGQRITKEIRENVSLVPVDAFEIYQCPERTNTYPGKFLDYVVNALDHRGPMKDLSSDWNNPRCVPAPTNGEWYEVKGAFNVGNWKRASEVMYIMDAATFDENKSEDLETAMNNAFDIRQGGDPDQMGIDAYDIFAGGQVPMKPGPLNDNAAQNYASMRGSWNLHMKTGSVSSFADAHAELVKPPTGPQYNNDRELIQKWYLKKMGVQPWANVTKDLNGYPSGNCFIGDPHFDDF